MQKLSWRPWLPSLLHSFCCRSEVEETGDIGIDGLERVLHGEVDRVPRWGPELPTQAAEHG